MQRHVPATYPCGYCPQGTGSKEPRGARDQAVPHSWGTDLQGLKTAGRAKGWQRGPLIAPARNEVGTGSSHSVSSGAKGDGPGTGLEMNLCS